MDYSGQVVREPVPGVNAVQIDPDSAQFAPICELLFRPGVELAWSLVWIKHHFSVQDKDFVHGLADLNVLAHALL